LPNVGPYIYDVSISGFTRSSIYIYDISSLRVKSTVIATKLCVMVHSTLPINFLRDSSATCLDRSKGL